MTDSEGYFKTRLSYEPKRDVIWKPVVRFLERFIPKDARILELGAGYCSFINEVKASEKHALDTSDIIKKHAVESVKTHICDCAQLKPVETAYFDVVFSSFLFEHLTRDHLDKVMRELRRIVKPGGLVITMLPNFKYIYRDYFDDYTHLQVFSHISFSDYITSHGFDVTHVEGRFLPYSFKSRLPKSSFLTALYLRSPWKPFAGNMLVIARNPNTLSGRTEPRPTMNRAESPHREPRPTASQRSGMFEPVAPVSILKDQKTQGERPDHSYRQSSRSGRYHVRRDQPRHIPASDTARDQRTPQNINTPNRELAPRRDPPKKPQVESRPGQRPGKAPIDLPRSTTPPTKPVNARPASFPKPEYIPEPDRPRQDPSTNHEHRS